jgi:putative tryptophan/tyrosine transport system substrate-binding protein
VKRRAFVCGSLVMLGAPLGAGAQQSGKVYRIGYLGFTPPHLGGTAHLPLVRGLRELGWVEGKNIEIEARYSEAKYERLPDLAAELVQLQDS